MSAALWPVSALLLGVAILLTGSGLQGILLPIRAGLEGFAPLSIGAMGSCYFAGFGAGCFYGPRLVGTVGHIRSFAAMTALATATALLHPFLPLPPVWWLLRIVAGFCFAVLYIVIESWLNERSTRETRGFVLSAYMIINLTVVTVGQMLLPLHDPRGLELFALVAMAISLAAVPVALTRAIAPAPPTVDKLRLGQLWALSPAAVAACVGVGFANGAFWALAPRFAQANGLDTGGIAWFMSAAVLGGAVGQWPLGRLSDRGDRRKVILLAGMLSTAAGALMVVRPFGSDAALLTMAAIWGACAFPIYSLAVAHANDHAAPTAFVATSSGLLLVYSGGAVLGPLLASTVTSLFGPTRLYAYIAVVHALLFGFVLVRIRIKAPPPVEAHVPFREALEAAQTVSPVFDTATQQQLAAARELATAGGDAGAPASARLPSPAERS